MAETVEAAVLTGRGMEDDLATGETAPHNDAGDGLGRTFFGGGPSLCSELSKEGEPFSKVSERPSEGELGRQSLLGEPRMLDWLTGGEFSKSTRCSIPSETTVWKNFPKSK